VTLQQHHTTSIEPSVSRARFAITTRRLIAKDYGFFLRDAQRLADFFLWTFAAIIAIE
jgi:hypothetical protein